MPSAPSPRRRCTLPWFPGALTTSDEGEETYEVSGEDLAAMMEAVNAGNSPESFEGNLANVDRSLVTVEVRNGSGIQGAAARCGELLTSAGYDVKSVGNVDDGTVYPETLVILLTRTRPSRSLPRPS